MSFQSTVNFNQGFGVPGELFLDGPLRAQPLLLDSADAAYNIIGATYFTIKSEGVGQAGGTGAFGGILASPKSYSTAGTAAGGALAPTLTLRNDEVGEFLQMGQMVVTLPAAAAIGDPVVYDTTTGAIATIAALASFTGVIAVTTGILTASALTAGGYIAIGSPLKGTGVPAGTVITSQLTGTAGSNGTYQTNIVTAVASTTMTTPNGALAAGATKAFVPNATVDRYTVTGAGLGVIKITD